MICAKIGPLTNRRRRIPCSSSRISVPVMSDGIRSGVNWIRLNSRSRMSASVLISSVLASPGTPVMRQWPPVNSAISTCSTTSSWPTMTLRSSARMRSRPSATFSALTVATWSKGECSAFESMKSEVRSTKYEVRRVRSLKPAVQRPNFVFLLLTSYFVLRTSVSKRVYDFVNPHPIGQSRVFDVAGILLGVRPLPAVAHVGVPVDEHHRAAAVVENRPEVGHHAAFFPAAALEERAEAGDLRVGVDLVEAAEHRVVLRHLDHLAVGEEPLHLAREVVPVDRTVEVVEVGRAAAQQEFAQDRQVAVEHLQVPRLDEVDPGILEQARIVERHDDRILDLNRGRGLDAAREVLLGRGGVDVPRLPVELLRDVRALGRVVIADADEAPL